MGVKNLTKESATTAVDCRKNVYLINKQADETEVH
jgi:hypothetical protein